MDPGADVEKIRPTQYEVAGDASDKGDVERSPEKETAERLDKSGLPLVPQPTAHRDDPLVSAALDSRQERTDDNGRTGLPP